MPRPRAGSSSFLRPRPLPLPPAGRAGRRLGIGRGRRLPLGPRELPKQVRAPREARAPLGPGAQALQAQGLTFLRSHSVCTESFRPLPAPLEVMSCQAGTGAPTVSIKTPPVGWGGKTGRTRQRPAPGAQLSELHAGRDGSGRDGSRAWAPAAQSLLAFSPSPGLDCRGGPSSRGGATGLGNRPARGWGAGRLPPGGPCGDGRPRLPAPAATPARTQIL